MSIYTVKGGDTLSAILKRHNVSNWASPATWAKISTPSGSPHLIRPGERLDLSPVLPQPKPAPAPKPAAAKPQPTPAQRIVEEIPKPIERPHFHDVIGGPQEKFLAGLEPILLQKAAERTMEQSLRDSVDALRQYGKTRGFGGLQGRGGAPLSGYGEVRRQNLLGDLEGERKLAMQPWVQYQKNLFEDWYGKQMAEYADSPDLWTIEDLQKTLPHNFLDGNYQLGQKITPGTYEGPDIRDLFSGAHTGMPTGQDLFGRIS